MYKSICIFILLVMADTLPCTGSLHDSLSQFSANGVKQESSFNSSEPAEPPARVQKPFAPQQATGAFWRTDHTFQASIRITNNLEIASLSVTPVLYMADGTPYKLAAINIPKLSVATVDINEALSAAPPQIASHLSTYGSAALIYTWRWQAAISGSIVNLDIPRVSRLPPDLLSQLISTAIRRIVKRSRGCGGCLIYKAHVLPVSITAQR